MYLTFIRSEKQNRRPTKGSCPKLPTDRLPHPATRVRVTKASLTRVPCTGTVWMGGKPHFSCLESISPCLPRAMMLRSVTEGTT